MYCRRANYINPIRTRSTRWILPRINLHEHVLLQLPPTSAKLSSHVSSAQVCQHLGPTPAQTHLPTHANAVQQRNSIISQHEHDIITQREPFGTLRACLTERSQPRLGVASAASIHIACNGLAMFNQELVLSVNAADCYVFSQIANLCFQALNVHGQMDDRVQTAIRWRCALLPLALSLHDAYHLHQFARTSCHKVAQKL